MTTDPVTCDGTPFNFQPEYSSAAAQNIIPWGFGPYMINDEYEIGHFEPCTKVTGPQTTPLGSINDTYYTNCLGPYETESDSGSALEPDDSPCYKFGDTHGGTAAPNLVTGCDVFFDAIGDLDYDGTPYYPDWPDSVTPNRFPSPFLQLQPTTAAGTGTRRSSSSPTPARPRSTPTATRPRAPGACSRPRARGTSIPYFTQARVGGSCVWEFGNMRNGNTFGGVAQYGSVGPGTLGTFTGPILRNPNC